MASSLRQVLVVLALGSSVAFVPPTGPVHTPTRVFEGAEAAESTGGAAVLEAMAVELNPIVKFWDPLELADLSVMGFTNEQSISWLRHAEIKHGRVAMAAFVGYCVQANGFRFGMPIQMDGGGYPASSLSPPEQWDALSQGAKWQIILFIGALEWLGEYSGSGAPHYMAPDGRPGVYPKWESSGFTWALPSLYDPAGFSKNRSAEKKARGLLCEINNGRLAMLAVFAFVSEAKFPGAVPALTGKIAPYDGNFWAPFEANFHLVN